MRAGTSLSLAGKRAVAILLRFRCLCGGNKLSTVRDEADDKTDDLMVMLMLLMMRRIMRRLLHLAVILMIRLQL